MTIYTFTFSIYNGNLMKHQMQTINFTFFRIGSTQQLYWITKIRAIFLHWICCRSACPYIYTYPCPCTDSHIYRLQLTLSWCLSKFQVLWWRASCCWNWRCWKASCRLLHWAQYSPQCRPVIMGKIIQGLYLK